MKNKTHMEHQSEFASYLKKNGLSRNTILAYDASVRLFLKLYPCGHPGNTCPSGGRTSYEKVYPCGHPDHTCPTGGRTSYEKVYPCGHPGNTCPSGGCTPGEKVYPCITFEQIQAFKSHLLKHYSINTVNLRISGINHYLQYLGSSENLPEDMIRFSLPSVKIQKRMFMDNIISQSDYEYFKTRLKQDHNYFWYFVIRFMTATGARVSELIQFKVEHLKLGYMDLYSKGGKNRRIYLPDALSLEALEWLESQNITTGFIFLKKNGKTITPRGIHSQLKKLASDYQLDPSSIYPHSFRHRFAKNFLEKFNDITLLADLMGHESIETTRIYLKRSSGEQRDFIDEVVIW